MRIAGRCVFLGDARRLRRLRRSAIELCKRGRCVRVSVPGSVREGESESENELHSLYLIELENLFE